MIRMLQRADTESYRRLRLQALQTDSQVFLSTFDTEHQRPLHQFEYEITASLTPPCFGYYGLFTEDGARLIGFCQAAPNYLPKQTHIAYLYNLYIDPDHRNQGLARQLLEYVIGQLRRTSLELVVISHIASNDKAHRLYTELGFQQTGLRRKSVKWQGNYDDEVEMALYLTSGPEGS